MRSPTPEPMPPDRQPVGADMAAAHTRRTKTAFLAHMRHELRTPVNAIIGYSELLLEIAEESGDLGSVADLQKINSAGRRLLDLIADVLAPSRIESEADMRIEDFEAEARHGLRTPINSIIGYADMLLEEAEARDREDSVPDLLKIRSAGERLMALIDQILSLWQVQAGRADLDLHASDNFQMVQETVTAIRPLAEDQCRAPIAESGALLVVDDNETNRDLLSRHLQRDGHDVSTAENGHQALDLLKAGDFDLVLLDILMPEMNGYEVLTHLKSDVALRHIPVIVLSALDDIDSVVRCIELGAEDYLPKPFNPVLLRARISASLEKKWRRDRELAYLEQLRVEREKSLRELLEEQFKGPAEILGNTRFALQLRNQAEKAAGNDQPLLVLGEPGTEKRTVAQLVHEKGHRARGPFLRLDCANVPAVVQDDAGAESTTFLQEIAQMSALFGHESGSFSFARGNRAGYLELADGGTLLLENVERLRPAVQERLVECLRAGKLRRIGSSQEVSKDVRIIATSHVQLSEVPESGGFNIDLASLLSDQSITVSPLRDRKRDMTAWVEYHIRTHSTRLGKEVGGITKEAMNMILAYDWPNNMEELESVVQRGVRLADGAVLTPEQIFIGLAPFEPRGKVDLLKISLLRRALESPLYPGILQAASVAVLGIILLSALLGPQRSDSNVALVLAWALWWPLLALGVFFTGRFFCAVCPMGAVGRFLQRRVGLRRKVPARVRQYGLYAAAFGFMLIIWVEQVTSMAESPMATAFLLLTILSGAAAASLVFDRAAWCRYICPLGRMVGTYATLSLVEIRSNPAVCSAECKTHGCYTGTDRAGGCPMYEGAFALQSNETCKFCADCLKNCANKAIRLNLRVPLSEIWTVPSHSLMLAAFIPVLIATVLGMQFRGTHPYREWLGPMSLEWLAFLGVLILTAVVLGGAMAGAVLILREPLAKGMAWLPHAFIPLALAGEIAHQMGPFLSQAATLLLVLVRQFGLDGWPSVYFSAAGATLGVRMAVLALGLGGSMYVAHRLLTRYQPSAKAANRAPIFLLVGFLSLSYGLLFVAG